MSDPVRERQLVSETLHRAAEAAQRYLADIDADRVRRTGAGAAAATLERLADVPLNVVCFRYRPKEAPDEELDALNQRLGAELLADGRVYAGTTRYRGVVAFRPAIVNWRTSEADVDVLVDVVRELGARLGAAAAV